MVGLVISLVSAKKRMELGGFGGRTQAELKLSVQYSRGQFLQWYFHLQSTRLRDKTGSTLIEELKECIDARELTALSVLQLLRYPRGIIR